MGKVAGCSPPTVAEIRKFTARMGLVEGAGSAAAGVDVITAMEELKAAVCGAQAIVTEDVAETIRSERRERGVAVSKLDAGIASQIGLARRESPHRGGTYLGLARALVHEMPHTFSQLRRGLLSEYRAMILVRETACLTADDRAEVDRRLCADETTLAGAGDRALTAMATAAAAELDAAALVRRRAKAASGRRVTVRPAPDFTGTLHALMPLDRAVCLWATLRRDADTLISTGQAGGRTRDQVMADLLYDRVTGASAATGAPVAVQVIVSDETLLAGGNEAAYVPGYGTIPAAMARQIIKDAVDSSSENDDGPEVALRRFYTSPTTGSLTAMESSARTFPTGLAALIDTRDRTCRTPWCDAPIRHHDHITAHRFGGPTSADNGMGLCEACNYAKEAAGWNTVRIAEADLHTVTFRTSTGHTYTSTAPTPPRPITTSRLEEMFRQLLDQEAA